MTRSRGLHAALAVVAVGAWLAYLIACRPSWSPDGSKILFPYADPEAEEVGIALFDKNTGKIRSLFVVPSKKEMPVVQWDLKGEKAIVLWGETVPDAPNKLHVLLLPVDSHKPTRKFTVESPGDDFLVNPFPELDGGLFAAGKKSLMRIDLETGGVKRHKLEDKQEKAFLSGYGGRIWYVSQVAGNKPEYEIGLLDPKSLALRPMLRLQEKAIGKMSPFMTVLGDKSAVATTSVKAKKHQLLVIDRGRLQKFIPLELSSETHGLGNLACSPDGKTVYAALASVSKPKDSQSVHFGFAEISVETGKVRTTPLLRVRTSGGDIETISMFFPIALSPDGKTIAASPTYFERPGGGDGPKLVDEADRALFLVDLTSPDRKVTRVPIPRKSNK